MDSLFTLCSASWYCNTKTYMYVFLIYYLKKNIFKWCYGDCPQIPLVQSCVAFKTSKKPSLKQAIQFKQTVHFKEISAAVFSLKYFQGIPLNSNCLCLSPPAPTLTAPAWNSGTWRDNISKSFIYIDGLGK